MPKKYKFDKVSKEVKHRRTQAKKSENLKLQMENEHLKMKHQLLTTKMQVTKLKQGGGTSSNGQQKGSGSRKS